MSLEFGRKLTFDAVSLDGESTTVVFDGLHMSNIGGLWEGVTVDSPWIRRATGGFHPASHEEADRTWSTLLAGRIASEGESSQIARLKRRYDGPVFAAVSSSCGGELQVLCRDDIIDGRRVSPT